MKFTITTTIAFLTLAKLGLAAPWPPASPVAIAADADGLAIGQRSPNPEVDWKTKLGWDGKVTPIKNVGEIISVSCFVPIYNDLPRENRIWTGFLMSGGA